MFKVNNKDTRTTIFIVHFEHISHLVSNVNFEHENCLMNKCTLFDNKVFGAYSRMMRFSKVH